MDDLHNFASFCNTAHISETNLVIVWPEKNDGYSNMCYTGRDKY